MARSELSAAALNIPEAVQYRRVDGMPTQPPFILRSQGLGSASTSRWK